MSKYNIKAIRLDNNFNNVEDFKESMSEKLLAIWVMFENSPDENLDYNGLKTWQYIFEPHGLKFDFGMDAIPYDFRITKKQD